MHASPRPSCEALSASALAAVDASVRAAAEGNRLREAGVLADPDSGMWLIAGPFQGPAGQGEGALGMWATSTDPTIEPFTGTVYAVDDAAAHWSTAPATDEVAYDPRGEVPVLALREDALTPSTRRGSRALHGPSGSGRRGSLRPRG